ncbi:hypothetical protein CERSUDRAFT_99325 [Gelatoporia subvermispora B]|uniref:Uncharacterized protein n=1 Tax=Ceriporiopsis subvermispora (strain B) TaxID=914234 RepID=M2QKD9_CERS8|nr:hypothetical protein CERSUDRAFT_99325 [Gelatoporia subvermispora B]
MTAGSKYIYLPSIPTSCPSSPPLHSESYGRGIKLTHKDVLFGLRYILWKLNRRPELSRQQLCDKLAERAPHHSQTPWSRWWSDRLTIWTPAQVLSAARAQKPLVRTDVEKGNHGQAMDSAEYVSSDEGNKVVSPSRFTEAEWSAAVTRMASTTSWHSMSKKDKWAPLHKQFPHRTIDSFSAWYFRNKTDLDAEAEQERARLHR